MFLSASIKKGEQWRGEGNGRWRKEESGKGILCIRKLVSETRTVL